MHDNQIFSYNSLNNKIYLKITSQTNFRIIIKSLLIQNLFILIP